MTEQSDSAVIDNQAAHHKATRRSFRSPLWTQLRNIGNSTPVKWTVFIPVVGYAIIFNEQVVHFLQLSQEILAVKFSFGEAASLTNEPNISWRLLCLYFGLTFVAVASLIYGWKCPILIKKYATSAEFVAQERPHLAEFTYEQVGRELAGSEFKEYLEQWNSRIQQPRTQIFGPGIPDTLQRDFEKYQTEVLSLYFSLQNSRNPVWRWVTAILFVVGFGIAAVPSVDVFCRVFVLLLRTVGVL